MPGQAAADPEAWLRAVALRLARRRSLRDWVRRRRKQIGAVATVLAVGVAVPLLRTQDQPDEVPPPPAPVISDIGWADLRHGYALRTTCARCAPELLTTEDAEHWQPRRLPAFDDPTAAKSLRVLGQRRIIVETARQRWYSADAGLQWRRIPTEPAEQVAAIPAGAILESRCTVVSTVCHAPGALLVVLPDSGRSATLANPPALNEVVPGPVPVADGSWWASGRDPATGRVAVAVSRNSGVSWSVRVLPELGGIPISGLSVTAGPDALYATAYEQVPGSTTELFAIFRSTDGGTNWVRTWQSSQDREPGSINGVAVAAGDRSLIVFTEAGVRYTSPDGGKTFAKGGEPFSHVEWRRGEYLATSASAGYFRSPDGVRWTRFTVG